MKNQQGRQRNSASERRAAAKSGKQRRGELQAKKQSRAAKVAAIEAEKKRRERESLLAAKRLEHAAVNPEHLAPFNSYGVPDFVARGYYVDKEFTCRDCGRDEVWTATQQKWWYEVAKGTIYSTAIRCRNCRRRARTTSQGKSPRLLGPIQEFE